MHDKRQVHLVAGGAENMRIERKQGLDCLDVKSHFSPAPALLYRDVLLPCNFSMVEATVLVDIGVIWQVKSGDSHRQVYKFDGQKATAERAGSWLDVTALATGNASLYLPDLTLQDAGEYTCTVFAANDAGKATLTLKVAAQPTMSLLPMNPSLMAGESRTFLCDLSGFYPEDLEVIWYKRSRGREAAVAKNICTGLAVAEDSGTFRLSSQIASEFSLEDGETVLTCEARHVSLLQPLRIDSTVYLKAETPGKGSAVITAAAVCSVSLVGIMVAVFVMLHRQFLSKAPPMVSPLIIPEQNTAGEKMVAMCSISGFRPQTIGIRWYVNKPGEEAGDEFSEAGPLLTTDLTGNAQNSFTKRDGVFHVMSQLSYTPGVQDDGSKLVCTVEHKALGGVTRQERRINVTARPTKMYLTSLPLVPHSGDKLTLSCIVEKFYPKPISMTWVKNREQLHDITLYGPFPCDGQYYSAWSQIEVVLSEDDDGANFICQISHSSLGSPEEISYEVNLDGKPPEVQFISVEPPYPSAGVETRLSCMIRNFSPMPAEACWFRDGVQQEVGVSNSVCLQSSRELYSMCSILRLTPHTEDHGSTFTCRVQHAALKKYQERSYTLGLCDCPNLSSSSENKAISL
ncbi:uncharacterized protein PAF06_017446 [Gastrophryne carolinensis]